MKIAITGATGLIGRALVARLEEEGHGLVVFSRSQERGQALFPNHEIVRWDAMEGPPPSTALEGLDGVVHLLGEGIADSRWTAKRKDLIRDSRVHGTRNLVKAISECDQPPRVLVSGSAVGFYGSRGDESLDESSAPGRGFLPEVCQAWETEAQAATRSGPRTVLLRTGIVLSTQGGALAKMLLPFKLCLGGPVGSGKQWMSWIHLQDQVELILHVLNRPDIEGPFNATAPDPATNRAFSKALGRALSRPAFAPAPGFVLKLILGEMAQPLLLEGQKVLPKRALETGYVFRFPDLDGALEDLVG